MKSSPLNACRNVAGGFLVLCIASWFAPSPATGKPVTAEQARTAVGAWLAMDAQPLGAALGRQVKEVQAYADALQTSTYYIVSLDPAGFVIVPGDDLVEPIIGFSPTGQFTASTDNPLGALVINDLTSRLAQAQAAEAAAAKIGLALQADLLGARGKWNMLLTTDVQTTGLTTISDVRVPPFVVSKWSQDTACYPFQSCYNYYTPPGSNGSVNNYPTGCVATAMAQLMRFHQHPTVGVGTASFSIQVCGVSQSRPLRGGDGLGGPYNWTSMPLDPETLCGVLTVAQRQAIGALCHDAGVAVNVDYCSAASGGSSAVLLYSADAFKNTFQYSNAIKGYNNLANITGPGFNGMANANLDAGYPVLVGIIGGIGGHAVVCDGYGYNASTLYHHLNMGWWGQDDAWYSLPTVDTGVGTFNTVTDCIYNVYVTGQGEIISGRVTNSAGQSVSGATVTAQRTGGGTYTDTTDGRGIYALAKVPSASTYSLTVTKTGCTFTGQNVTTGTSTNLVSTSGNCWGVDFSGTCACLPPTIASITPNGARQGQASATVTIVGTDFVVGQTTVKLTKVGQSDIIATNIVVNDATRLTCTLPLTGAALGRWSVVVTTCASGTLTDGFEIYLCGTYADDNFETGNLSKLPWQTGGNAPWYVTNSSASCGTYAARAGAIPDGGLSYLQVTLTRPAGNFSFCYRVSSEKDYDYLRFTIDGEEKKSWSGNLSWGEPYALAVSAGSHTYRWEYTKDPECCTGGSDTAWIDEVTFPAASAPTVTGITPNSGRNDGSVAITNLAGTGFQSGASVKLTQTGQPDIAATGVTVVNATKITCTLNLLGKALGRWSVVVTNSDGQSGTLPDAFTCYGRGDFDHDADADLADFLHFQCCFNGPNVPPKTGCGGCEDADLNPDGDVDLADFMVFQDCFNGPNRASRCG